MIPITRYIDTDTGTLVISEHPDKVFISVAGGRSMFLDPSSAKEAGMMLFNLGRAMEKRR